MSTPADGFDPPIDPRPKDHNGNPVRITRWVRNTHDWAWSLLAVPDPQFDRLMAEMGYERVEATDA
jgi:hypothetical protein